MNQCKYCGKEIPEGRKFCNHSCSAAYNNGRRKRKPWTEEQKKAVQVERVEQICKYCGQKIGKLVRKQCMYGTCQECKPYAKFSETFNRLGIEGKTLQEKYSNLSKVIENMYFEERKSLSEISKKMGLWYLQIERFLWRSGNTLRDLSESQKLHILQSERSLPIPNNSKYKHGWYTTWEGKRIFYRSSYELEYALQLDEQQISYDVEDLRIEYFDTQRNEKRVAIPNFHLLDTNEIIEIKSTYTFDEQLMKDKFKAYKALGYLPKLILDKKEYKLQ